MTTNRHGSGPATAAPTVAIELTDADLTQILDALGMLAIEHHRHAVLADDPSEAARHRGHERAVDELVHRLNRTRVVGAGTAPRSEP